MSDIDKMIAKAIAKAIAQKLEDGDTEGAIALEVTPDGVKPVDLASMGADVKSDKEIIEYVTKKIGNNDNELSRDSFFNVVAKTLVVAAAQYIVRQYEEHKKGDCDHPECILHNPKKMTEEMGTAIFKDVWEAVKDNLEVRGHKIEKSHNEQVVEDIMRGMNDDTIH